MWEPQRLTTLRASKACRGENFTFYGTCRSSCNWFLSSDEFEFTGTYPTSCETRPAWIIYLSTPLQPYVGPRPFFNILIYTQSVGFLGRRISLLQSRYLHTEQHIHRLNPHRYPCHEWDSNQMFERAKTVHALDRAASLIGILKFRLHIYNIFLSFSLSLVTINVLLSNDKPNSVALVRKSI
jgi:hypothetical protein